MSIKKFFLWYLMLTKRLFHKFSFIVLLCLIPVMVFATNGAMSEKSGVLKIMLCSESENSGAEDIIESLLDGESIILFQKSDSVEEALNEVQQHRADAVWCFADDFDEKAEKLAGHKSKEPLIRVYEREDTVPLQLSKEKLYGAIYDTLSYNIYKNFVYTQLVDVHRMSEAEVKSYYDEMNRRGDIVELESVKTDKPESTNYLTAPLRGMLSLLILLCGLAAAMYYLKDKSAGKFDWMPEEKRIIPAFAQCLSAVIPASVAVLAALCFANISVGIIHELTAMAFFVVSSAGFCLLLCTVFRSSGKLGAAVPGLLIAAMVSSPVFFSLNSLKPLSIMIPTYYYLNSVYNTEYYLYSAVYILCVYGITLVLNYLLKRREGKISILS